MLEEFTHTIQERGELFRQQEGVFINDIDQYNQYNPQTPLPRIILIIDEVHKLFAGNDHQKDRFSQLLKDVAKRGRSFGVHIILSTQGLQGAKIDDELMGQINLRCSFKLTSDRDIELIFGFHNRNTQAKELGKYQLIYNNNAGDKAANVICRANPPQDIAAIIEDVRNVRDSSQMITPVIARSKPPQTDEPQQQPINPSPQHDQEPLNKYSTDNATDLLAQLVKKFNLNMPATNYSSDNEQNHD